MANVSLGFIVAFTLAIVTVGGQEIADQSEGWSSRDASLWVSPKYNLQDPLSSYTPGEIRGPLEYEIKFSCRGRRNGYYADLDHSCKVWHYCNTTREINPYNGLATWTYTHFSYACLEDGTRYDQVQKECIPEAKSIVRCQDSEYYYPTGDYVYDVAVPTTNRLVPVRCPTSVSDVKCSIQKDHINLQGCPESPGAVVKFYSSFADLLPSPVSDSDVTTVPTVSLYSGGQGDAIRPVPSVVSEVSDVPANVPVAPKPVPVASSQPVLYHPPVPAAPVNVPRPHDQSNYELTGRKTAHSNKKVYSPAGGRKIAPPAAAGRKSYVQSYTSQYVDGEQLIFPRRLSQPLAVPIISAITPLPDAAFEPVPVASSNSSESAEADFLGLPVGSTKILGDKIDTSFDCSGRSYGYYADVKNQCKVYHVCSPKTDEFGVRFYEHFSFVCAEGLVFDQRKITCVPAREASHQCSDSERYFEKTSEQFHKEHETFIANRKSVPTTEATPPEVPAVTVRAAPKPLTVTVLHVKSIEPEVDSLEQYSKVNAPSKSVGPPRVFLKEPTVPTRVQSDEYDHDTDEVALRGDQSPDKEEQVNQPVSTAPPPVKRPPKAPSARPVNFGTKTAYASPNHPKKGYAPRPVVKSPVNKRYPSAVAAAAPVPVPAPTPAKRVVYRLKKGNRAPVSYTGRVAPYLGARKVSHNPHIAQQVDQSYAPYAPQRIQHSPHISQGLSSPGVASAPKQISHNPSISQYIAPPAASPVPAEAVSHNPSVSQYVAAPGSAPSAPQAISHNPSISQYVAGPEAVPSAPQAISHNPSVSQYVAAPAVASLPPQALSHSPSIVQYVGASVAPSAGASISHSPSISQYVPEISGSPVSGAQTISHNPSIHQVIVRSDSSRPTSRLNW